MKAAVLYKLPARTLDVSDFPEPADWPPDGRVHIPVRVVAAGAPSKVEALTAALRAGLITVLVTDVETAHSIIKDRSASSRP
jgi:Putative sugar-binding domain